MPRKATAKQKIPQQPEVAKRSKRQIAKNDAAIVTPVAEEEPIRARRSSTAAQTAASVADATRGRRSSRSQTANQSNSSESGQEPGEIRSSRRIIKKINYQEIEADDEDSQAKKVEKGEGGDDDEEEAEEEEEAYNAEEDVENDSDSGDVGRTKAIKAKPRSPPSRTRGRPQRGRSLKEETPTKVSPRGRRAKAEEEENEPDFVAPTRKGRYEEDEEEEMEETNAPRGRSSNRSTRAKVATPKKAPPPPPQRPVRTSRRQQSLKESKEEEEESDENQDDSEDTKESLDEKKASDDDDDDDEMNVSRKTEDSKKKRKARDEPQTRKRQKTSDEGKTEDDKGKENEKQDAEDPMDVDEVDTNDESDSTASEPSNKKTESKPELLGKEEASAEKTNENKDLKGLGSGPDGEKESSKSSPVKVQASDAKPVISAKTDEKTAVKDTKDKPAASAPETKKTGSTTDEEKRKNEDEGKTCSPTATDKTATENDAKSKDLQPNSIAKPSEGLKSDGATFNGDYEASEKAVRTEAVKASLPSTNIVSTGNVSNSLGTASTNPDKEIDNVVASNGVHCNQNLDFQLRNRKYLASSSIKEDERLSCKDRIFDLVSYNISGDSMQMSKSLLELVSRSNGVVCLQNVSEEFYRSHLKGGSHECRGYNVIFHVPSGLKVGLATLYKSTTFTLKHHKWLPLKDVITKDLESSVPSSEEKIAVNGHLKNCGHMLLTYLMFNDRPLIVANVSIPPTDLGTHTLQMSYVARESLNFLEGTNRPILICGTFNVQENNAAYQLLRDGSLSTDMIELLQSKKDITVPGKENTALVNLLRKSFQHPASTLKSCYASVMGSELKVSGQNTTLPDLMWYSSDCLKTLGILGDVENPEQASTGRLLLKADMAFSN